MIGKLIARLKGLYFGWRMIGVSCAIRVLGGGLHAYGVSVFFLPITQELNLSRTATSLVFSMARAQGALEGPIAGYYIDRYGPRPVIAVAIALAGIGYLLLSGVHSYGTLLVVYMGVISLSYQAGFMDATMSVANTWFIRKRALAMSITSGSIALGGALLTPGLAFAVHLWGWRTACILSGTVFLIVGLPLALKIRRSPEAVGLKPDGDSTDIATRSGSSRAPSADNEWSMHDTLRSYQFWGMTLATTFRSVCSTAVLVHFVPILVWKGYSQAQAAFFLGVIAICGMPTHLIIGWLGDRLYKPRMMSCCMLVGALALYMLFRGDAVWQLWIAVLLFSVFEGLFGVTWATVGDFFGRNNFAKIRGSMSLVYTWGSFLGPLLAGAIYDHSQSYARLFWVLLAACLITSMLYASLVQPTARAHPETKNRA